MGRQPGAEDGHGVSATDQHPAFTGWQLESHPVLELHRQVNERTAQVVLLLARIEQLTGYREAPPDGVLSLRRLRALEDVLDRARVYLRSGEEPDRLALTAACESAGRQP